MREASRRGTNGRCSPPRSPRDAGASLALRGTALQSDADRPDSSRRSSRRPRANDAEQPSDGRVRCRVSRNAQAHHSVGGVRDAETHAGETADGTILSPLNLAIAAWETAAPVASLWSVRTVLAELRKSPAYRRARVVVGGLMTLLAVIGFAGIAEDLETWVNWLGGLGSNVVAGVLYGVLLAVGLALLATEGYRKSNREDVAIPIRRAEPKDEPESAPVAAASAVAALDQPTAAESGRAHASESSSRGAPRFSDRLQAQLDEGVRLRRDIPGMPGITVTRLVRAETTEADVTMWIKRTERILRKADPELLSEFRYRPGKAILSSFMEGSTILDPPSYKKALDQRIANLRGIIEDLRDAGR